MSILLQSLKIIHKVFVATSTFCVKKRVTVKAQFLFFRAVSLVLAGFSFRGGGGGGLGNNSGGFWGVPGIP